MAVMRAQRMKIIPQVWARGGRALTPTAAQ